MQDNSQARHPTARNKGKDSIFPDNVDTPTDEEISSSSWPDLSPAKSSRVRSRKRLSHHSAFSNADSATFRRARREAGQGQNQPNGVPGNAFALHTSVMPPIPPMYPAFGTWLALYIPHVVAIRSPDDMLSSLLG